MEEITTKDLLTILLFAGMPLALFAINCAKATFENPRDRNLLGIPFGVFGFFGYLSMLIALNTDMVFFYVLIGVAALVTPIFMWKSIRLRKLCPFCVSCWAVNIALVFITVKSLL